MAELLDFSDARRQGVEMDSITSNGWSCRFRFRTIKKKKRDAKGKVRGRYEGEYVYLRVVDPDGRKRDIYLGTTKGMRSPTGARNAGGRTSVDRLLEQPEIAWREVAAAGGRSRGQKAPINRAADEVRKSESYKRRGDLPHALWEICPKCEREYGEHDGSKCPTE